MSNTALNEQQAKFVKGIVQGKSQKEAYMDAYGSNMSVDSAYNGASRLMRLDKVQNAIIETMESVGINNLKLVRAINRIIDEGAEAAPKASDVLKAVEMSLNIKGVQTTKPQTIEKTTEEYKLEGKSIEELKQLLNELEETSNRLEAIADQPNIQPINPQHLNTTTDNPKGSYTPLGTSKNVDVGKSEDYESYNLLDHPIDPSPNEGNRATYSVKREVVTMS